VGIVAAAQNGDVVAWRRQIEERLASPAEGETTMSEQATSSPRDLEAHVIARAWRDEAFRQELLRDPKAALGRELAQLAPGAALPEDVEIHVLAETPTTRYLVLPAKPVVESDVVLTDADLAPVAGGIPLEMTIVRTGMMGECYCAMMR
jgi:hypothetical protein